MDASKGIGSKRVAQKIKGKEEGGVNRKWVAKTRSTGLLSADKDQPDSRL